MNKKLSTFSILIFIFHSMLGIQLLILPRIVSIYAQNDSWISILLLGIATIFCVYSYIWLGLKYPGLNYSEILQKTLGMFLGKLSILLFTLYYILHISLNLKLFSVSLNMYLLERTPSTIIIIVLLLPCIYALKLDIYSLYSVLELLMVTMIFFIFVTIILIYKSVDLKNLLPILSKGLSPVLQGSYQFTVPIAGAAICGYILPILKNTIKVKKWAFIGTLLAIFVCLVIVVSSTAVLGSGELKHLLLPTIILGKSIQLKTQLFARSESLIISTFIPGTFTSVLMLFYISTQSLKVLFNTQKVNILILIQVISFIYISKIPKNIIELTTYINYLSNANLLIQPLFLFVAIIITLIKSRWDKHDC